MNTVSFWLILIFEWEHVKVIFVLNQYHIRDSWDEFSILVKLLNLKLFLEMYTFHTLAIYVAINHSNSKVYRCLTARN